MHEQKPTQQIATHRSAKNDSHRRKPDRANVNVDHRKKRSQRTPDNVVAYLKKAERPMSDMTKEKMDVMLCVLHIEMNSAFEKRNNLCRAAKWLFFLSLCARMHSYKLATGDALQSGSGRVIFCFIDNVFIWKYVLYIFVSASDAPASVRWKWSTE